VASSAARGIKSQYVRENMNIEFVNDNFSDTVNRGAAFVRRQIREISQAPVSGVIKKMVSFFGLIAAVVIVIIVRLLRPIVLIRFGYLRSNRLGHFTANTEVYLCERDAGLCGPKAIDFFYYSPFICNQQLKKMWDRILHVYPFVRTLDRVNRFLPAGRIHICPFREHPDRDIHGLFDNTKPHLSFTADEERKGQEGLRDLGIPDGAPFVCFHSRSPAYLKKINSITGNRHRDYHSYRDTSVSNLVAAAEELTGRGYYTIRMGAVVEEVIESSNLKIIDYATNGRTEFLDIYLGGKCHFYFGDPDGFCGIPMIFRQPMAIANQAPVEQLPTWASNYLVIFKKLWLKEKKRFLTLREIMESPVRRFNRTEQYEQAGIELIENSPEEIKALAVEMDERLKGTWQSTEEDEQLQQRFWSFFKPGELNGVYLSRIGAEFLRQNRQMLE